MLKITSLFLCLFFVFFKRFKLVVDLRRQSDKVEEVNEEEEEAEGGEAATDEGQPQKVQE